MFSLRVVWGGGGKGPDHPIFTGIISASQKHEYQFQEVKNT
jgi:hypothetical protein